MSSISRQHVLELGVGLALDRHAAEVADIAVIVAAGIEREDVALVPRLIRRRAIEARAGGDQAIVEGQPAARLLAPERLGQLALVAPGPCLAITACIESITRFGRDLQLLQFARAS